MVKLVIVSQLFCLLFRWWKTDTSLASLLSIPVAMPTPGTSRWTKKKWLRHLVCFLGGIWGCIHESSGTVWLRCGDRVFICPEFYTDKNTKINRLPEFGRVVPTPFHPSLPPELYRMYSRGGSNLCKGWGKTHLRPSVQSDCAMGLLVLSRSEM